MKHLDKIATLILGLALSVPLSATDYWVATDGSNGNDGSQDAPFATLTKALQKVQPGDNVYIRGGEYTVDESWVMNKQDGELYVKVFDITQKATEAKPIRVFGVEGERPVFNMSGLTYTDHRIAVFYVSGSYWYFKNFEVTGTQVGIIGHTQSECFRIEKASNNTIENVACHSGMAIGFYLTGKCKDNLIVNCDAYDNIDLVSEGDATENVDGFGGHVSKGGTGNKFIGCRAWNNGDDGFDLINCHEPFVIENCWALRNGYRPAPNHTSTTKGNGNGFKAGGYGMTEDPKVPETIPVHEIRNCLALYNKDKGFYANHHLGGILFENNTSSQNGINYDMTNRVSAAVVQDVPGYGRIIRNNISHSPRNAGRDFNNVNRGKCTIDNNSFAPQAMTVADTDFLGLDEEELRGARQGDGSLPKINTLRMTDGAAGKFWGMGCFNIEIDYSWMQEAAIVVEGNYVRVVGTGAESFTKFFINGEEVAKDAENGKYSLAGFEGILDLKATTESGGVTILKIKK